MPAINDWSADTEFNAILRSKGIIPDLRPSTSRSPSPEPVAPSSPSLSDLDNLSDDDSISRSVIEEYREKRLKEQKVGDAKRKWGRVYPIGKKDYTREVTEASREDLEGEPAGSGTGVVCYLFKDYLPECKHLKPLLDQLAALYPSTKIVSIVSDHCIENYPDKNCPTLLVYRKGELMGQVTGMGAMNGMKATIKDLERIIFAFRGIDEHLRVNYLTSGGAQYSSRQGVTSQNPAAKKKGSDEEADDSEDDQSFVGGGKRSGIRSGNGRGGRGAAARKDDGDESDEFDL